MNRKDRKDGYSDSSVINMWKEALEQCDQQIWEKYVRHTHEIIGKWYAREQNIVDIGIQPITIDINTGDSSDSEYEDD